MPINILPIAERDESETILVLDCSSASRGTLYYWSDLSDGFRYRYKDWENVCELYFPIDDLFSKFGPRDKREDIDGVFLRLNYLVNDPRHGPELAKTLVNAGYDINFVLPTYRHPIFNSIDSGAFGVAIILLELGTSIAHKDTLNDNATIGKRLSQELNQWQLMCDNIGDDNLTGKKTARKNIESIKAALAAFDNAT